MNRIWAFCFYLPNFYLNRANKRREPFRICEGAFEPRRGHSVAKNVKLTFYQVNGIECTKTSKGRFISFLLSQV